MCSGILLLDFFQSMKKVGQLLGPVKQLIALVANGKSVCSIALILPHKVQYAREKYSLNPLV